MKKILLLFCLIISCQQLVWAQAKPIRNSLGQIIAFECSDGNIKNACVQPLVIVQDTLGIVDTLVAEDLEVVNLNSSVIVKMDDELTIIDLSGATIAVYDTDEKELRDNTGHLILRINDSGQILNAGEVVLGWVDSSGNVFGNDSNLMATAPGIAPFKIGYFLFFTNK